MKQILSLIALSLLTLPAFSQQVNDALLLDYYQNQRYLEASNYLKSIYPEPINDIKALSRLAYTSQMAGKLPDAEGYYQRIYGIDSNNTAVLYNLGSLNLRRGNYNKAEVYYKKLISKDSTDYQLYKYLANIRLNQLDTVGHLKYLEKANKLNPIDFAVASDLGDIYIALKKYQQAEKVLLIALEADPENFILLKSNFELAFKRERWLQAIKIGEQIGSEPIKLGIAYFKVKNYICCLETLLHIRDDKQTETSYYFIAASYKQLKDQKTAIKYFKKAIELSIPLAIDTYYNEMADSYQTLGKYDTAEAMFKKGLLYDHKPLTYYYMAILYDTKLKQPKSALAYYKKYIAANPPEADKEYVDYSKSRVTALSGH
jgi:tetratricopeptide (TPR) repeat protein